MSLVSTSPLEHGQIALLGTAPLDSVHGRFVALIGRNRTSGAVALAIHLGDVASEEPLLARIHSSCITSETFGGCDCDCVEQLDAALARIAEVGRGVVFYLMQEGRGAGFAAKARDRMLVQASQNRLTTFDAYASMGIDRDSRRYEEVGDLCGLLGVRAPLVLLTSNPEKLAALRRESGVDILDAESLAPSASPWNRHYIAAKSRSGHHLADPSEAIAAAEPPEPVEAFAPYALPDERFLHLATYWLPIRSRPNAARGRASAPTWFRLHAYADRVSRLERVVLAFGRDDAVSLVRVQRESLLERFPLAGAGRQKSLWHRAVRQIVDQGAGAATFLPAIGFDERLDERSADLEPGIALLAHHLRGRAVRLLVAEAEDASSADAETARRAAELLDGAGVRVLDRVAIGAVTSASRGGSNARSSARSGGAEPGS